MSDPTDALPTTNAASNDSGGFGLQFESEEAAGNAPSTPPADPQPTAVDPPKVDETPPVTPPADPAAPVDPDNPEAPAPADPSADSTPTDDGTPDFKSMSKAERAAFFTSARNQARQESQVEANQAYDAAYQPQEKTELIQQYQDQVDENGNPLYDRFQSEMLAERDIQAQRAEIAEAKAAASELSSALRAEAVEIVAEIDWTNPKSPNYDEASAASTGKLYDRLCLTRDPRTEKKDAAGNPIAGTGQVIEAKMLPKEFFTLIDTIRSSANTKAAEAATNALEQRLASAPPAGSSAPPSAASAEDSQAARLSGAFNSI